MKRAPAPATLLVLGLLLAACGGGGGSDESGSAPPPTTAGGDAPSTEATEATEAPSTTATTSPAVEGTLLEPGDPPTPWSGAEGAEITVTSLAEADLGAFAIGCPPGIEITAGVSTQCTAYNDEGGPYVGLSRRPNDGVETTTLWCQVGDGMDFTPALQIDGRLAAFGPGASDGEGRFFQALAIEVADGVHWYVVRRPAGEPCPVVWDLGLGDGTTTASSSIGGATFPLADGPSCTRIVAAGLAVRPGSADGICV